MCVLKNARLLLAHCKGNEILFRINISLPRTTIAGLDGAGQCFGLPGNQTSHQWTSSYGATLKPWFTRRQLILKRILLPVLLRQKQPSGSNLPLFSTHVVSATSSSALYGVWWPYIWTSALNWYKIQLKKKKMVLLDFQPQSDPTWWSVALQGRISWQ